MRQRQVDGSRWVWAQPVYIVFVLCQAKLNGETLPQKNINMVESHRKIHMMLTSSICMHTHRKTDRQKDKHTHMKKKKVKIISCHQWNKEISSSQAANRKKWLSESSGKVSGREVAGEVCKWWSLCTMAQTWWRVVDNFRVLPFHCAFWGLNSGDRFCMAFTTLSFVLCPE